MARKIKGTLSWFAETGTEGAYWVLLKGGETTYEAMMILESDHAYHMSIKVPENPESKKCNFEIFNGNVVMAPSWFGRDIPYYNQYFKKWSSGDGGQFVVNGIYTHHFPVGIDLKLWIDMCFNNLHHEATITKLPKSDNPYIVCVGE